MSGCQIAVCALLTAKDSHNQQAISQLQSQMLWKHAHRQAVHPCSLLQQPADIIWLARPEAAEQLQFTLSLLGTGLALSSGVPSMSQPAGK